MKDKYIEEKFPIYFVFGEHDDGRVDIASAADDTIATVTREHAEVLIQQHNILVQALCDLAQAFNKADPTAFKTFWYK
jgi:hypothetical protein